ncbi:MAG: hypothetical protein H6Q58_1222 [Firmicutes bacterium]|nr:hypothetical protein [Bacillota bacterium]
MTKKILSVLAILVLAFSLAACVNVENKKAAANIDMKITALGATNTITLDSSADVEAARKAYDALTSEQKELVTKLVALAEAETKITELRAAADVDLKIAALGDLGTLTLDKSSEVRAARTAYESLTSDEKALVTKLDGLRAAENKLYIITKDKDAAAGVDSKIMELKAANQLTVNDTQSVANARSAYSLLTVSQKSLVSKLDVLRVAENQLYLIAKDAEAAAAVDIKIMEIKAVGQLNLDDTQSVANARNAYNLLTDNQKSLVTRLDVLKAAENQLYLIAKASKQQTASNSESGASKWAGKTIVTYGDSITWYNGEVYLPATKEPGVTVVGYQSYMRNQLDARVINRGVSGYTTPEISRYIQSSDLSGVDAVTILAGTNDFRDMMSEPLGEISSIGSSFNEDTFIGAYQKAIEYILNNYPGTKIYLFTPIQAWEDSLGLMPETYPQAVINLGALYSLPVCDLYHQSGINESTKSVYIVDSDEVPFDFHPSTEGYAKMASIMVPFLENH